LACSAILWSFMDTVGEPGVSPRGPPRKTLCPALPSLQWVPWVAVPHLHRYYAPRRLPPARLGSLRLSLASRYRACFMTFVVSPCGLMTWAKPPGHARAFGHPVPHSGSYAWRQVVLPSSRVTPLQTCPALRPRWYPVHSPLSHTGLLPSGACKPSAFASIPLRLSS
jgi:hypothetical protein